MHNFKNGLVVAFISLIFSGPSEHCLCNFAIKITFLWL